MFDIEKYHEDLCRGGGGPGMPDRVAAAINHEIATLERLWPQIKPRLDEVLGAERHARMRAYEPDRSPNWEDPPEWWYLLDGMLCEGPWGQDDTACSTDYHKQFRSLHAPKDADWWLWEEWATAFDLVNALWQFVWCMA
jgi:hypothetical protein